MAVHQTSGFVYAWIKAPLIPPPTTKTKPKRKNPKSSRSVQNPHESLNPIVSPSRRAALSGLSGLAGLAVSLVSPSRRAGLRHRLSTLSLSLVSPSLARSTRLSVLLLEIANEVSPLTENRWEEPSRLNGKAGTNNTPVGTTKCLECRGEGRILCMECDGTGEQNIEPQFLEWVDEGTKCPYCEGLGYTTCDTCFSTEMELTWIKLLVFMACLSFPLMVECRDRHYKFDVSHCSSTLALSAMMLMNICESQTESETESETDFLHSVSDPSLIPFVISNEIRDGIHEFLISVSDSVSDQQRNQRRNAITNPYFRWDPSIDEAIVRVAYDAKACVRYGALMHELRALGLRPDFITDEAWNIYRDYWASTDFRARSEKASHNRKNEKGGPGTGPSMHTSGTRSFRTYEDILALDKDEDDKVTPNDVFLHVHTEDHDGVTFIDNRSGQFHRKLVRRRDEHIQATPDQSINKKQLYYDVAGDCPKGRVYRLRSLARKKRRCAYLGASTSHEPMQHDNDDRDNSDWVDKEHLGDKMRSIINLDKASFFLFFFSIFLPPREQSPSGAVLCASTDVCVVAAAARLYASTGRLPAGAAPATVSSCWRLPNPLAPP
ncbi:hypothetical protein Syun_000889 [Stephania yunnanensis]|uniref:Uncharacterized protein n=1 Tax=Stephania yunnanensis TaxID=152371 RepID=A0AAP0LGT7_9MAGN